MHAVPRTTIPSEQANEAALARLNAMQVRLRPRYQLVSRVSTVTFRAMVASGLIKSPGWTVSYRKPGNTISIGHARATMLLFGHGDDIYLCRPVDGARQERA